jgi:hypothetical protein
MGGGGAKELACPDARNVLRAYTRMVALGLEGKGCKREAGKDPLTIHSVPDAIHPTSHPLFIPLALPISGTSD